MCKHTSETRVCRCRDLPTLTGRLSDRGTAHLVCQIAEDAALSGHMHQPIDRTHLYIRPQSVMHAIIINMSIVIFLGSGVVPAEAA